MPEFISIYSSLITTDPILGEKWGKDILGLSYLSGSVLTKIPKTPEDTILYNHPLNKKQTLLNTEAHSDLVCIHLVSTQHGN